MKPNVIAIIPARGGSKGIPRKNIRLLRGKPLITYVIEKALSSKYIDTVAVSTENEEIANVSLISGAEVILRPQELAEDNITLDPVVFHAVKTIEEKENSIYDFVVTIQPTSPLLSKQTIDEALDIMFRDKYDTLISVVPEAHLYWMINKNIPTPLYKERKNRQDIIPLFRETGALVICRREVLTRETRIGKNIYLFELLKGEAIDIDDNMDWLAAESLLSKLNIVFRVDGDEKIGLGHIYRAMTLASRIFAHNTLFLTDANKGLGISKLRENNCSILPFNDEDELFRILGESKPDIVINDILDTDRNYMQKLRERGFFVINFEDLGEGAELAHIVVNALYENSDPPTNHYYGYKYECLREEFYLFPPITVHEKVEKLLITMGGVDSNNLTLKTLRAIQSTGLKNIYVTVILGLGYALKEDLRAYVEELSKNGFNIELKENINMMARYMAASDLVITSNGRTLYEVASLGIPCISISQNEREVRHLFPQICKGIKNLGIAFNVSEDAIASALKRVIDDYHLRQEMSESMLKFDFKKGIDRTLRLIFDKYWE